MNRAFIYLTISIFLNCSAQKDTTQIKKIVLDEIEEVQLDTLIERPISSLHINDYDLRESLFGELEIIVNQKGLYQYKDSTLVNAETKIYLHKFPKIDKDNIPDCGEPPIEYGYLEGNIENGRKEGKWYKKIKTPKRPHHVIVKILHYKKGMLEGKYQVYNTEGRALYPSEPHPLFPDEYRDYQIFENGTGWYYDYYYETGMLKIEGFYKNNIKDGKWVYYDKNGDEAHREYYKNGVLINQ